MVLVTEVEILHHDFAQVSKRVLVNPTKTVGDLNLFLKDRYGDFFNSILLLGTVTFQIGFALNRPRTNDN